MIYMLFFCHVSLGVCEPNPALVYDDKGQCEVAEAQHNRVALPPGRYKCFGKQAWQPVR